MKNSGKIKIRVVITTRVKAQKELKQIKESFTLFAMPRMSQKRVHKHT